MVMTDCRPAMLFLLQGLFQNKYQGVFLVKITCMLTYDKPLFSGQPALSGHWSVP